MACDKRIFRHSRNQERTFPLEARDLSKKGSGFGVPGVDPYAAPPFCGMSVSFRAFIDAGLGDEGIQTMTERSLRTYYEGSTIPRKPPAFVSTAMSVQGEALVKRVL